MWSIAAVVNVVDDADLAPIGRRYDGVVVDNGMIIHVSTDCCNDWIAIYVSNDSTV